MSSNLRMHVSTVRLKRGRFRGNLNSLRLSADLELRIDADNVILVHKYVRGRKAAKSLLGDLDPVGARGDGGYRVRPGIVRLNCAGVVGRYFCDSDGGARNRCAAGVGNAAHSGPKHNLAGRWWAGEGHEDGERNDSQK